MQICRLLHPSCYRQLCHGVRISLLLTTVETTMAEWKYEIRVRLHISGTVTLFVQSNIVSKLERTTAVDLIKASFRVKGKDFATAVQTFIVDMCHRLRSRSQRANTLKYLYSAAWPKWLRAYAYVWNPLLEGVFSSQRFLSL